MKMNKPAYIGCEGNLQITLQDLKELDFIEVRRDLTSEDTFYIDKEVEGGWFSWLSKIFGSRLGKIYYNKKEGAYFFKDTVGGLNEVMYLGDWKKIKAFMECLE